MSCFEGMLKLEAGCGEVVAQMAGELHWCEIGRVREGMAKKISIIQGFPVFL